MSAKFSFIVTKGPAIHRADRLSMAECQQRLGVVIQTNEAKVIKLTTELTDGLIIVIERDK